jgi:cytochrome c-type biogenesis protein CcmF
MALATVAGLLLAGVRGLLPLATFGLCAATLTTVVQELVRGVALRRRKTGAGWLTALVGLVRRNRRRYGGYLVHVGIVLMYIGFAGEAFKLEREVVLSRGQQVTVGDYSLTFEGVSQTRDAQKAMSTATLTLSRGGRTLGALHPARWIYFRHQDQPTTEVAIRRSAREDLFVALGEHDTRSGAATFKVVVNPLVNWIWIGFILLSLGTLVAIVPARLQRRVRRAAVAASVLLPVLLLWAPVALADPPAPGPAAGAPKAQVQGHRSQDLENRLLSRLACMCPTCPRIPLDTCQCGFAAKERAAIRAKVAAGWGEQKIIDWYVKDRGPELGREPFGAAALTTPPDTGFNRLSWLLPYLLSALAVVALVLVGRRWTRAGKRRGPPPAAEGPETDDDARAAPGGTEEQGPGDAYEDLLDRELRKLD